MHGIIQNGFLVVTSEGYDGARPVVYEDVPEFDQAHYYVRQQFPVDAGSHIFMGIEVVEMNQDDTDPDGAPY